MAFVFNITSPINAFFNAAHRANKFPLFLFFVCTGCNFQAYQAKPILPQKVLEQAEAKSPADEKFISFLQNKGYPSDQLPLKSWDLKALVDCALFFHPSLDVARAQWRAAQASEALAARPISPTMNANIGRSNRANGDINPFAYQFSIDIPINTHHKSTIQIESFSHLTEAAKLEIAQTAWGLRHQVALSFNEIKWQETQEKLLKKEMTLKKEIVSMLEKRKQLGLASSMETSQANLQLQLNQSALDHLQKNKLVSINVLAKNIGLPVSIVNTIVLNLDDGTMQPEIPTVDLQKSALLNRLDVRIALERYAVAEAKVKLEIAKQYPDLSISPGYAYEFGDKVWSLGLSRLLSLLKNNKSAIFEAEQLREVEVAQFDALQADIIAQTNTANAKLQQAQAQLSSQTNLLKQQQKYIAKSQAQFNAGEIDRLTMTLAQLEFLNNEKETALAEYQLSIAWLNLENTLQIPLIKDHQILQAQLNETKN